MEELIKKLKEAGKLETIKSEEDLRAAAKELGYSDEDIDNFMSELSLDDDALEQASGGQSDAEMASLGKILLSDYYK